MFYISTKSDEILCVRAGCGHVTLFSTLPLKYKVQSMQMTGVWGQKKLQFSCDHQPCSIWKGAVAPPHSYALKWHHNTKWYNLQLHALNLFLPFFPFLSFCYSCLCFGTSCFPAFSFLPCPSFSLTLIVDLETVASESLLEELFHAGCVGTTCMFRCLNAQQSHMVHASFFLASPSQLSFREL